MTKCFIFGTDICHGSPFTFDLGIHGKEQGMFRSTDSNCPGCGSVDVSDNGQPDILFLPIVVPTIVFQV